MTYGKWAAPALMFVAIVGLASTALVNGNLAAAFTLPTLAPTIPPLVFPSATFTPTPTPTTTPSPFPSFTPAPTWTSTPGPTATPTETPTATPTETPIPTFTPTPFSLTAPTLVNVTTRLSDTTPVPTAVSPVAMAPDTINIVVLGSDRRPDWTEWHTDAIHVVSIQPRVPVVTVLSIPRDLYVYIPGFWMSRINFADVYGELYGYPGGGPALVQQTLLYNLGIPVDHYVRTDFDGFIGIIDALGGIDIPVHCRLEDHWPYPDEHGKYPIKVMGPGVHHMDGETALWYARSRLTTDAFSRERRQQQVLRAIWRKSLNLDLLPRVPELWEQYRGMVITDVTLEDVVQLAGVAFQLDQQNVRLRSIGREHVIPWTTPKGGSVYLPNWEKIEPVVSEAFGPVPEGRLWRSLQAVEVWNGTSNGDWDRLAADRLQREGFGVVLGEPDRRDYSQTLLIDFTSTSKGSSVPYLQSMFSIPDGNVISAPNPDMPVSYRLIIGADYRTCPAP
jgi:LCP family protein required for cell wall assembly